MVGHWFTAKGFCVRISIGDVESTQASSSDSTCLGKEGGNESWRNGRSSYVGNKTVDLTGRNL